MAIFSEITKKGSVTDRYMYPQHSTAKIRLAQYCAQLSQLWLILVGLIS